MPADAWHGMILVDKPAGMTSQHVVSHVKRLTQTQRAGHTGTLDPFATGLLPVCINEGTKLAGYLLSHDKSYRATLQLGCQTDTGDITGLICASYTGELPSLDQIEALLPRFVGEQDQTPPRYAAIKFEGRKYYEYAREGIEIERPSRRITIFSIELIEYKPPHLILDVSCSSGTYIRSLSEDIGNALGCGSTLSALRRTSIDQWHIDQALALDDLIAPTSTNHAQASAYISCAHMAPHLPSYALTSKEISDLYLGRVLHIKESTPHSGIHRLFHGMIGSETFIGLGDIHEGVLTSRRLVAYSCLPSYVSEQTVSPALGISL